MKGSERPPGKALCLANATLGDNPRSLGGCGAVASGTTRGVGAPVTLPMEDNAAASSPSSGLPTGAFSNEFQGPFEGAQERLVAVEVGALAPSTELHDLAGEARHVDERGPVFVVRRHRAGDDHGESKRAGRDW